MTRKSDLTFYFNEARIVVDDDGDDGDDEDDEDEASLTRSSFSIEGTFNGP